MNGDDAARSPYRAFVKLSAARWGANGSPVDAEARVLRYGHIGLLEGYFDGDVDFEGRLALAARAAELVVEHFVLGEVVLAKPSPCQGDAPLGQVERLPVALGGPDLGAELDGVAGLEEADCGLPVRRRRGGVGPGRSGLCRRRRPLEAGDQEPVAPREREQ